jgi:hypothetical protein
MSELVHEALEINQGEALVCTGWTSRGGRASEKPRPTEWLGRQDSKLCIPNDRIELEGFRRRSFRVGLRRISAFRV